MKKSFKIVGLVGILLMMLISTTFATEIKVDVDDKAIDALSSLNLKFSEDEVVNADIFLSEDNISIKNIVNGNVYLFGESIEIDSDAIDGDVFVIGENVVINSNIEGNAYIIATNLSIEGKVKDVFALSGTMNINKDFICRDIKTLCENVNVSGIVNRDLYVVTGDVNISNTGKIGGILSCSNEITTNRENVNEVQIIEDVTAGLEDAEFQMEQIIENAAKSISLFLFFSAEMTGIIIIGIIVLFTSKKQINNSELIQHGVGDSLYGLLYLVIFIFVIIALIFTLIGIPVALLLCFALWLVFWKITIPVASIQFAKATLRQENKSKVLIWFIAFFAFTLAQCTVFIPTVGSLIKGIISIYGFGYMIRSVIRKNKAEEINSQVETI